MVTEYISPKMAKLVNDPCYGLTYESSKNSCSCCWIKQSCESTYRAYVKKKKSENNPKAILPREKKYKKTDKYREWY
jgi:hypothetical protein